MIKRDVVMPIELIQEIAQLVHKENYFILKEAFPSLKMKGPIFLSQEEAEALIDLAVIEKKKARLRYPYYDDEHPLYDENHEDSFDDVQMGIYEKTIYYVESAFKKNNFRHLL
ncbi:hypothetical protein HQQ94_01435 [Shewanella sp. VB17]|uniref:hypothetical protein n=1 Tax=Shewanella sp. VB17 TaxID=2739432 RepID=UPI001565CA95|nr:hypothetical protein [Shewanella sp. VB17]NRD71929.1 hypothetical protein [Shewanella sp. VB17]